MLSSQFIQFRKYEAEVEAARKRGDIHGMKQGLFLINRLRASIYGTRPTLPDAANNPSIDA